MVSDVFFDISFPILVERFKDIFLAPFTHPDMLWIAAPLILVLFLTELYFSRYKFEELGWNSAYGNALVLLFVSVDLFRYLYGQGSLNVLTVGTVLAFAVFFLAFLLIIIDFFHLLPEEWAYGISSKLPINFIAYMGIILVYTSVPVDLATLLAAVVLLLIFSSVIILLHSVIPTVIED